MLDFELMYGVVGFIIILLFNYKKLKSKTPLDLYIICSFYIYIICVISVAFFPILLSKTPIDFIFSDFINLDVSKMIKNYKINPVPVIGNFVLLFPLGFYMPIISKNKKIKYLLIKGFMLSISIELLQLIISLIIGAPDRICDINDLISNMTGYFLGYIFYIIILPIVKFIIKKYNIKSNFFSY